MLNLYLLHNINLFADVDYNRYVHSKDYFYRSFAKISDFLKLKDRNAI